MSYAKHFERKSRKVWPLLVWAVVLAMILGGCGSAAKFPERPITIIVHAAAGGGSDKFARMLAASNDMDKFLAQPILVENKTGGSGAVAFDYVAGQKGDPYFLLTAVTSFMTTPLQGLTTVTYKDFTPIANLAFDEFVVVVKADSQYQTMLDLVNDAKARPQAVKVGGTSLGSADSICAYLIEKATGVKFNYVVFNSGGETNAGLMEGNIDFAVSNPGEALDLATAGDIRILGVLSETRLAGALDVPTLKEQGINAVYVQNRGLVAPSGISAADRKVLEEALFKYTQTKTFKKYIADNMLSEAWMDGATFGKWLEAESGKYAVILRDMGVIK
jgi:putative tricarboxylic transport membrane protein